MIEFASWSTPFGHGDVHVISVEYGKGPFNLTYRDPQRTYRLNCDRPEDTPQLTATLFDAASETPYEVSFERILAFRVLDEHGLTELWSADTYDPKELGGTFLVRNHMWHRESPIAFSFGMNGEWSYMIATEEECLEIISSVKPKIIALDRVHAV